MQVKAIDIKEYTTWTEFTDQYTSLRDSQKYIWRGHSNSLQNGQFSEWKIISSYNRDGNSNFSTFITQVLDNHFNSLFSTYSYHRINELDTMTLLERCYFLQHYGVSTAFIDFTFDPLVALYFAITSLPISVGLWTDPSDNVKNFPTYGYASVFQINLQQLFQTLGVKAITEESFDKFLNDYVINQQHQHPNLFAHIAVDANPSAHFHNLKAQKSCFLLFDFDGLGMIKGLGDFIEQIILVRGVVLSEPLITIHRIPWNSLLQPENTAIYFLQKEGISGKTLFDDIQGLKYDFRASFELVTNNRLL